MPPPPLPAGDSQFPFSRLPVSGGGNKKIKQKESEKSKKKSCARRADWDISNTLRPLICRAWSDTPFVVAYSPCGHWP